MTSQEISEFVNQPAPRKVPRKVFLTAIDKSDTNLYRWVLVFFAMILGFIYLFQWSIYSDFLLDIGYKDTAQGAIISITQEMRQFGSDYHLRIRFPMHDGEIETSCYVTPKENIPGWGVIPETWNNPCLRSSVRLETPFPVTIEYIPWNPYIARAVGTRHSIFPYFFKLISFVTILALIYMTFAVFLRFPRAKRLLREGLFAAGRISISAPNYIVSFTDQCGMNQERIYEASDKHISTCRQWAHEGRSVGLLYLPDQEKVIITDLWLEN